MYLFHVPVISYGSIFTSVLSLSSTGVDVLLLQNANNGNLKMDVGIKTVVSDGNVMSYLIAVVLSAVFIVFPKLIMYSWTMAMYRWEAFTFFAIVTLIIFK